MASKPVPKKAVKSNVAPTSAKSATNSAPRPPAGSGSEMAKIDSEILKLINRRAAATAKLIESDPNWWSATYDPRSDDDLLKRIEGENQGPLPADAVRGVFRQILSAVRNRVRPRRVTYLGPAFSFTHMAAVERFGESSDLIPVKSHRGFISRN